MIQKTLPFRTLAIIGIILILTSYVALAASEVVVAAGAPHPDIWAALADKVPGLVTLVFLVLVFFRHLDKKNAVHSDTINMLVTKFDASSLRHEDAMREVATVLDKVKDSVERLEKK